MSTETPAQALSTLAVTPEPQEQQGKLSAATHDLCQHVEKEYARLDHTHKSSRSLGGVVREHLRPLAARTRSESGPAEVKTLLDGIVADLQVAEKAAVEHSMLPFHLAAMYHLALPTMLQVVDEIKAEYCGVVHVPRPDLPHFGSSATSRKNSSSSSGTSSSQERIKRPSHFRDLSVNSFKRTISPPVDARPLTAADTFAFETAVACSLEHNVPRKEGDRSPKHALDILAGSHHKEDPLRELVVLTAGHHTASDVRELF